MVTLDGIVLGGGSGSRFSAASTDSSPLPKQFQRLGNAPVLAHALRGLLTLGLRQIVVAVPAEHREATQALIEDFVDSRGTPIRLVTGGERRQDSSRLALEALELGFPAPTRVLIHDGCRPFLSPAFLGRLRERLVDRSYGAWVPVVPVTETLKRVENGQVTETVDREQVRRVQTPQIFEYDLIRTLAERARDVKEQTFTDDASLCEYYGIPVGVFDGDERNIKLTYPHELETLRVFVGRATCEPASDTTFTV